MAVEHVERIGARIRARREELGLSRKKLAAKMHGVVSENDLYRWERGQHRPGDNTLEEIARALDVDAAYFLVAEPEPGTADLVGALDKQPQLDRIEQKLDELLAALSNEADYGLDDAGDEAERSAGDGPPNTSPEEDGSSTTTRAHEK